MKKKIGKEVIILFALIPLFTFAAYTISKYSDGSGNDYTVSGKGTLGYSIIYEAVNKSGLRAFHENRKLEAGVPPDQIQVVTESFNFSRYDENMKEWVESGGSLLMLTTLGSFDLPYGSVEEIVKDELKVYRFDKGTIIIANARNFTNKGLSEDTSGAYDIVKLLLKRGYGSMVFNEYYIYGSSERRSLWRDTPYGIKLVLYQCLLGLGAFLLYKGRRFGRVIQYLEEVERTENEYVFSAASLFKKAKSYDVVIECYVNMLLSEMKREFKNHKIIDRDNWFDVWKKEGLEGYKRAVEIDNIVKDSNVRGKKEFLNTVSGFEDLIELVKKRRSRSWK